ncbi:MAG: flagellar biosynthesis protein FliQ [Firmicutes bacterium]|nr:flagellar biosynthesis protein FliQ [Bacillota bacterium]
MTESTIISLGKDALMTVILVAGPVLGLGMLVGLIVSIFQATTQIQEQTLTFIPKILAVLLSIVIFGPWMLRVLIDFGQRLLGNLTDYIM